MVNICSTGKGLMCVLRVINWRHVVVLHVPGLGGTSCDIPELQPNLKILKQFYV